jgi:hypothetical protein
MENVIWFRKGHDEEYRQWLNGHMQDGYVMNKEGSKWTLHTPNCPLILAVPLSRGQSLTTYAKICSTSTSSLEAEARRYNGNISTNCTCHINLS